MSRIHLQKIVIVNMPSAKLYIWMQFQNKVSDVAKPFVQSELAAVIKKECDQREQLWMSGIVKSTRMAPRACEDHISDEEVWLFCCIQGHNCQLLNGKLEISGFYQYSQFLYCLGAALH